MSTKRFKPEQIVNLLRQIEVEIAEVTGFLYQRQGESTSQLEAVKLDLLQSGGYGPPVRNLA